MFIYLLYIIIFLGVLHLVLNYNERARMIKKIPGPKMDFVIGDTRTIMQANDDVMKVARKFAKTWNGIYSLWVYPNASVFIFNPEDIEIVMSNIKHSDKSFLYQFLKPWLGDGLLVSKGTKWQERRKILTPTFHFNILKQFCEIINENCDLFVEKLKNTAGKPIAILPVLSEFTLNSICETAMGTKLSEDDTTTVVSYKQALYCFARLFYHRAVRVYLYPDLLFNLSDSGREQGKHIQIMHSFTESVIKQRTEYVERNGMDFNALINDDDDTYIYKRKKTAMLDLLISAKKNGLIDKAGIQEEVDTFMVAGHETTASGLTFCLMLIANHREVQDKIREEIIETFGNSKRPIKIEDLNKMKYLDRCIKESLRMYPPVHYISRTLNEPTVLSNYKIPAGTICHISIFDLHYREDQFKNPTKFDPDRFLPENCLKRHPYAYIPFSAGPRNCIGQKFAIMEMKIAVTKVLQEFELLPVTGPEDLHFTADFVLRHKGPVLVNFIKREH